MLLTDRHPNQCYRKHTLLDKNPSCLPGGCSCWLSMLRAAKLRNGGIAINNNMYFVTDRHCWQELLCAPLVLVVGVEDVSWKTHCKIMPACLNSTFLDCMFLILKTKRPWWHSYFIIILALPAVTGNKHDLHAYQLRSMYLPLWTHTSHKYKCVVRKNGRNMNNHSTSMTDWITQKPRKCLMMNLKICHAHVKVRHNSSDTKH